MQRASAVAEVATRDGQGRAAPAKNFFPTVIEVEIVAAAVAAATINVCDVEAAEATLFDATAEVQQQKP